jgi:hypothetical protein
MIYQIMEIISIEIHKVMLLQILKQIKKMQKIMM